MSKLGMAMAGGKPAAEGEGRRPDDFYPTPPEVLDALLAVWRPRGNPATGTVDVWEPCCGDGVLVRVMQLRGWKVYASDLVDRTAAKDGGLPGFRRLNVFTTDRALAPSIVTNPPFSGAEKLIRHALGTLGITSMALLLKATFWNAGGRLRLFHDHPPLFVLPVTWRVDFLGQGAPTMDVQWVCWGGTVVAPPNVPAALYCPLPRPAAAGTLLEHEES